MQIVLLSTKPRHGGQHMTLQGISPVPCLDWNWVKSSIHTLPANILRHAMPFGEPIANFRDTSVFLSMCSANLPDSPKAQEWTSSIQGRKGGGNGPRRIRS